MIGGENGGQPFEGRVELAFCQAKRAERWTVDCVVNTGGRIVIIHVEKSRKRTSHAQQRSQRRADPRGPGSRRGRQGNQHGCGSHDDCAVDANAQPAQPSRREKILPFSRAIPKEDEQPDAGDHAGRDGV